MRRTWVLALAASAALACAHVAPPAAIVALALPHLADCPGSLRSTAVRACACGSPLSAGSTTSVQRCNVFGSADASAFSSTSTTRRW